MRLPGRGREKPPTALQRLDGRRRETILLATAAGALIIGTGAWRKLRASDRPAAEPSPPAASAPAEPAAKPEQIGDPGARGD